VRLSADWELTRDERLELYIESAKILQLEGEDTSAFKLYFEAMKLINKMNKKEAEFQKYKIYAEGLLVSAIKSPHTINFEELMLLESV
jgi:hypothetical protein